MIVKSLLCEILNASSMNDHGAADSGVLDVVHIDDPLCKDQTLWLLGVAGNRGFLRAMIRSLPPCSWI